MRVRFTLLICLVIIRRSTQDEDPYLRFPEGFTIGAGGSAYQTEGGWNASDKGESIWDRFVHTKPWRMIDGSNADVACDSYHKYKEDVQWIKKMGLDHYRFSISWPRVLPNGFAESVSQDGLRYYHNLVDELLANDIAPIVSLYHWDHPQVLEDMGGWQNESMIEWFTDYANVIFRELGPKVKVFATINEPHILCGFLMNERFYDRVANTTAAYLCSINALKAHANVYHLYDKEYRPTQRGKIGLVSACEAYFPQTPNDTSAVEIEFQFSCGWISHPIFIGDYPDVVKARVAELNRDIVSPESKLPELSPEWIRHINGTADYFGLNHYTSRVVALDSPETTNSSGRLTVWNLPITVVTDAKSVTDPDSRMKSVPEGFRAILRKIKEEYNNPPVYVMENGFPDDAPINDYRRIKYIHSYLEELLLAVHQDGCNVQMYTVWSLLDNFEWWDGYETLMGLISVNFSSPNLDRSPKLSAFWLQNVTRTRRLQPPILPLADLVTERYGKELENITPIKLEEYQNLAKWINANITHLDCHETLPTSPELGRKINYTIRSSSGTVSQKRKSEYEINTERKRPRF